MKISSRFLLPFILAFLLLVPSGCVQVPLTTSVGDESGDYYEECPTIKDLDPNELSGFIIFRVDTSREEYLLDLENLDITILEGGYDFTASRDNSSFAFITMPDGDIANREIVYFSERTGEIRLENRDTWPDRLGILQITDRGELLIPSASQNTYTYFLLDPLTGNERELPNDFPGLKPPYEISLWGGVVFSPDTHYAVYPRNPGNMNNMERIVLWDVVSEKAITYLSSQDVYGGEPVWSPDGQSFIISLSEIDLNNGQEYSELYQIDLEGDVIQFTGLSAMEHGADFIEYYRWSPDGEKVSFEAYSQHDGNQEGKFMVVDLNSRDITSYCYQISPAPPVWSPDGQWVSIPIMEDDSTASIIINTVNNTVYRLPANARSLIWFSYSYP